MYKFSQTTVAEFYGRQFYSISDESGKIVAYSERVFEIPKEVRLLGESKTLLFKKALIWGGEIRGGEIWGGEIRGGVIRGGVILGGEILGGEIRGGVILGGEILGGEILGGVILGGEILGGVIRGGEILGGVIRGGEIRGGVIRGGVIWGGVILGGVYKNTLLQIQGSRHYCYATPTDAGGIELGIGCHIRPIAEWQKIYIKIGNAEGYTAEEIAEYGEYIALFAKRYGL